MTGQKRCCATCRYFQDTQLSGNGWCTHPKRKASSDVILLVRKGELACRDSWGDDFWTDASLPVADSGTSDSIAAINLPLAGRSESDLSSPSRQTASSGKSAQPSPAEDSSFNTAAHLEQEQRAAALRNGPGDALRLAWERSAGRKLEQQRPENASTATDSEHSDDETDPLPDADDSPVAATRREPRAGDDERDIQPREIMKAPLASRRNPERIAAAPVPISEVAEPHRGSSEAKYHTVPSIQPDIELPRLRNQFRLPGQEPAGTVASSRNQPEDDSQEMSTYDRVLQRAQAYRATVQAPQAPGSRLDDTAPADDFAIHSPRPANRDVEPEADVEPAGEDEVVSFQIDRSTRFSRFAHDTTHHGAELDNGAVEEDYELDRSYRPEPTSSQAHQQQQSGLSWWRTARDRVFGAAPQQDAPSFAIGDDEDEDVHDEPEPDSWDAPTIRDIAGVEDVHDDAFAIEWDNHSLAPIQVSVDAPASTDDSFWSSLDYLESDSDSETHLEPMAWVEEEPEFLDTPAPESDRAGDSYNWNLAEPAGMDHLRDRLFGHAAGTQVSPDRQRSPGPSAPVAPATGTLSLQDRFDAELPADREQYDLPPIQQVAVSEPEATDYPYDSAYNPDFDIRDLVAADAEPPLDMTITIAPDIPRKCATCRSFRQSETGDRGWCVNQWAFPHRPLVNAEDLACDSSLGCWWLPGDDAWDAAAYLAELAQPTPRTDRLEALLRGDLRRTV
jgi:hypothetical protein